MITIPPFFPTISSLVLSSAMRSILRIKDCEEEKNIYNFSLPSRVAAPRLTRCCVLGNLTNSDEPWEKRNQKYQINENEKKI